MTSELSKWGARAATVYTEAYAERYRAADAAADSRVEPAEWLRGVCHRFAGPIDVLDLAAGRAEISMRSTARAGLSASTYRGRCSNGRVIRWAASRFLRAR